MKRRMFQGYVLNSKLAVDKYLEAFNGLVISAYKNDDGGYYHCEINIEGEILAIAEVSESDIVLGDNMQLCLQYNLEEEDKLKKAYSVLKENAVIYHELSECSYSPLMADLIDQFGIRWCLFI